MANLPCTDLETERRFVATKLCASDVVSGNDIDPDDLCSAKLRTIYEVCLHLDSNLDKWGFEDVLSQLEQDGKLKDIGRDYLYELSDTENITLEIKPKADRLKTLARARRQRDRLKTAIEALENADYETADREVMQASESSVIGDESRIYTATDLANETVDALQSMVSGKRIVIDHGLPMIKKYAGGLLPGGMFLVGSPTNVGKTQILMLMGLNIASSGVPVGMIQLEDPPLLIGSRLTSSVSKSFSSKGMFTEEYAPAVLQRIIESIRECKIQFDRLPFYLTTCDGNTPSNIYSATTKLIKRGCKVVMLDYIQCISGGWGKSRSDELETFASEMRSICRRYGSSFAFSSQLTFYGDHNQYKRPELEQLRDCKSLGHKADVTVLFWRDKNGRVLWWLAKSKIGNVGVNGNVEIDPINGMYSGLGEKRDDSRSEENGEGNGYVGHWQD